MIYDIDFMILEYAGSENYYFGSIFMPKIIFCVNASYPSLNTPFPKKIDYLPLGYF